jgi:hypothetical protein
MALYYTSRGLGFSHGLLSSLSRLFVRIEFESSRHFQFSFTDFSLLYRSAFAQIFPRSQPMREFKTSTLVYLYTPELEYFAVRF